MGRSRPSSCVSMLIFADSREKGTRTKYDHTVECVAQNSSWGMAYRKKRKDCGSKAHVSSQPFQPRISLTWSLSTQHCTPRRALKVWGCGQESDVCPLIAEGDNAQ